MDVAEALAVERGASAATLETHSFGAQNFYLKRGYTVFGRLDDYLEELKAKEAATAPAKRKVRARKEKQRGRKSE